MPEICGNHLHIHEKEDLHVEVTTGRYPKDCIDFPVGLCVKVEDWAIRGTNPVYGFLLLDCQNLQNSIGFFKSVDGIVKTGIDVQMEKKDGTSLANFTFVNGIGEIQNEITMGTYVNNEFISLLTDGTIDVKNLRIDGENLTTVVNELIQSSGLSGIQGEKGDKGDKGDPGIQGPAGTGSEELTSLPIGLDLFSFNARTVETGSSLYLVAGNGISVTSAGNITTITATGEGGTLTAHAITHEAAGNDKINLAMGDYQSTVASELVVGGVFKNMMDRVLPFSSHLYYEMVSGAGIPNNFLANTYDNKVLNDTGVPPQPFAPLHIYNSSGSCPHLDGDFSSEIFFSPAPWVSLSGNMADFLATGIHVHTTGNENSTSQAAAISASRFNAPAWTSGVYNGLVGIMGQGPGVLNNITQQTFFGLYAAIPHNPNNNTIPIGVFSAIRGTNGDKMTYTAITLSTVISGMPYAIYCENTVNVRIPLTSNPVGLPAGSFYRDSNGYVRSV
jgi:hypothetical protein